MARRAGRRDGGDKARAGQPDTARQPGAPEGAAQTRSAAAAGAGSFPTPGASAPSEPAGQAALAAEVLRRRWRLLALVGAVFFVLWLARDVIGPFVVGAVLAYAFSPVVSTVEKGTGLPRVVVIGVGYLLVFAGVAVLAFVAAERAGSELRDLSAGGRDVIATALHKLFGDTIIVAGQRLVVSDVAAQIRQALLGLVSSPTSAVQVATQAVDFGLQAILALIVTFYFLLDGRRFGEFALRFLDRSQRAETLRIAHRIHEVLGRWLRGQLLLIGLVAAVLYVILGPLLHVPYALALAILSGVLEIIPLVGPLTAAALAGTVTFAAHGTDTTLLVLVLYAILREVEDQLVMPIVIGRAVHLHPVMTIFAVLVGLSTWGVFGGLMAVPVAAALNVTLRELYPDETGEGTAVEERKPGLRTRFRLRRGSG